MRYASVRISPDTSQEALAFAVNDELVAFADVAASFGGWENLARAIAHTAGDVPAENLRSWFSTMLELIEAGPPAWRAAEAAAAAYRRALQEGRIARAPQRPGALIAPIPRPRKNIFSVGRNYAAHARERGADTPEYPMYFTKPPTTVAGPREAVPYPSVTSAFDYEGELAVVIGRRGRDIPRAKALEYVFGYTIVNDLTARDLQARHVQFFKGKSLDGTCPMGPVIVTPDELRGTWPVTIETRVNGELRQRGSTDQMIFDVPALVAGLSEGMTLEPGDIIATGTPAGVGAADGRYLKAGDRIDITISGIGTLTTTISSSGRPPNNEGE